MEKNRYDWIINQCLCSGGDSTEYLSDLSQRWHHVLLFRGRKNWLSSVTDKRPTSASPSERERERYFELLNVNDSTVIVICIDFPQMHHVHCEKLSKHFWKLTHLLEMIKVYIWQKKVGNHWCSVYTNVIHRLCHRVALLDSLLERYCVLNIVNTLEFYKIIKLC